MSENFERINTYLTLKTMTLVQAIFELYPKAEIPEEDMLRVWKAAKELVICFEKNNSEGSD